MKNTIKAIAISALLVIFLVLLAGCNITGKPNEKCEHKGGAATCTDAGICTKCGKAYLDPLGHTEVVDKAVAATCTSAGLTEGKHCSVCKTIIAAQEPIKAIGHIEVVDKAVAATCTSAGLTEGKHCSVCKTIIVAQEPTSVLDHTEVIDKAVAATCTSAGLTEGKHCSVCKTIIEAQQPIGALGHTEVIDKVVAATCTKTGLTEGKHCSVCKTVIIAQTETPIIAHTYTDKYDESCNECGFIRDAECAHTNVQILSGTPATCTQSGLTNGEKCKKCGEILVSQNVISALGHTEVIDKAVDATCTKTGLTEGKHCSVCNTVIIAQVTVPIIAHTEVIDKAVAATCTTTGLTEGKHCSVCNKVLTMQIITPVLGHDWDEGECNVAETCTSNGVITYTCERCKETKTETVLALGHNYSKWFSFYIVETDTDALTRCCLACKIVEYKVAGEDTVYTPEEFEELLPSLVHVHKNITALPAVDPTCLSGGYLYKIKCLDCGEILHKEVIDALGHNWQTVSCEHPCQIKQVCERCNIEFSSYDHNYEEKSYTAPTCTSYGSKVYSCTDCEKEFTIPLLMLPHDRELVSFVPSTCSEHGSSTYRCKDCGDELILTLPKLPHSGRLISYTAPTCTAEGERVYICQDCGERYTETISKVPHSIKPLSYTAPTCSENGKTDFVCRNCGLEYSLTIEKVPHDGKLVNYIAPTCSEFGREDYVCRDCGAEYSTTLLKTAHKLTEAHCVAPTCTEMGMTTYICRDCGEGYTTYQLNLGHNMQNTALIEPTCTARGSETNKCTRCGIVEESIIPMLPHDLTCSYDDYSHTFSCTMCGGEWTDPHSISVNAITTREVFTDKVTYTTVFYGICKGGCGYEYEITRSSIDIPLTSDEGFLAVGVVYEYDITEPSCLTEGLFILRDKRTGEEISRTAIPAVGHHIFGNDGKCVVCGAEEDIKNCSEGLEYTLQGDDTYSVTGIGTCTEADIIIPDTYKGKEVTNIGFAAFEGNETLTSVIVPESVTSISNDAFRLCINLTSISIPKTIEDIGSNVFLSCISLRWNEYDNALYLGNEDSPFLCLIKAKDYSITSCIINEDTKIIASYAFGWCSNLNEISIPDKATNINAYAFYVCENLKSVQIGDNVKKIGEFCFQSCTNLEIASIGSNVIDILGGAFIDCKSLTKIEIPNSVINIGGAAFYNCTNASELILGNNVNSIGNDSFYNCSGLTSVVIPDSVTSIGNSAFSNCSNLTHLTIGRGVVNIGEDAFWRCFHLVEVYNKSILDISLGYNNYGYVGWQAIDIYTHEITEDRFFVDENGFVFYRFDSKNYLINSIEASNKLSLPKSCNGDTYSIYKYSFYGQKNISTITFEGTVAEWNAIYKGLNWNSGVPATEVVCSDGTVSLE